MVNGIPDDIERIESGSGGISTSSDGLISREVEIKWLVHSIEGYQVAEEKGVELAPLFYSGHRRSRLDCRAVGNGWYEIAASYGNAAVDAYEGTGVENDRGLTFVPNSVAIDTTGGTERITQAWTDSENPDAYVGRFAKEGDNAPDTYGAVNVSGNTVNGVDITVPSFQFTETWHIPAKFLFLGDGAQPTPYLKTLYEMSGKVNLDKFRVFDPGEVLFLGARLEANRGQTMVTVTFSFAARENRDDFWIGDVNVLEKDGWDYLWIEYEEVATTDRLFRKPKYVFVDRVYERKKFSEFGIGVEWQKIYLDNGQAFAHPLDANLRGDA